MRHIVSFTKSNVVRLLAVLLCWLGSGRVSDAMEADLTRWTAVPAEFVGGKVRDGSLILESGAFGVPQMQPWKWVGWLTQAPARDLELRATLTVKRLAVDVQWFGQSWSVWPDPLYGDGGFEAGVGLAVDPQNASGYRVQFSHKYQCVALVRYPQGGVCAGGAVQNREGSASGGDGGAARPRSPRQRRGV